MESKPSLPSTQAAKMRPKPLAEPDAAEAIEKAKVKRFLRGMAMFQKQQDAEARASAVAPDPSLAAIGQSRCMYELPLGLHYISNSLKIDDPPTPMRIGQLDNFIEKTDPWTGKSYWVGLTWAEVFYPVLGERPRSVVGSKAYEVVLKQATKDGGQIVRENVLTTGRVVGVVVTDLPYETVSVKIDDWFLESDVFEKGHWHQLKAAT